MNDFISMPIPTHMFAAVCALLGGTSSGAIAASAQPVRGTSAADAKNPNFNPGPSTEGAQTAATGDVVATGNTDQGDASGAADAGDPNELDAGGWPWSADMHASTKGKTKEGYWRMKVGVSRPDPKPGFPKDGAPTAASDPAASGAASAPSTPAATAPAVDEDDEFAAFANAAAAANGTAASVPARKWTDADLGKLCNQAAVKLGSPDKVREQIAKFVPAGEVPHSRNVPEGKREEFAKAVEDAAGITFEG